MPVHFLDSDSEHDQDQDDDLIFALEMDDPPPAPRTYSQVLSGASTAGRRTPPTHSQGSASGSQTANRPPTYSQVLSAATDRPASLSDAHPHERPNRRGLDARARAFLDKLPTYPRPQPPSPPPKHWSEYISQPGPSNYPRPGHRISAAASAQSPLTPHHQLHDARQYVTDRGYNAGTRSSSGQQQQQQRQHEQQQHQDQHQQHQQQHRHLHPHQAVYPVYLHGYLQAAPAGQFQPQAYYFNPLYTTFHPSGYMPAPFAQQVLQPQYYGYPGYLVQPLWYSPYGHASVHGPEIVVPPASQPLELTKLGSPQPAVVCSRPLIVNGSKHNYDMRVLNRLAYGDLYHPTASLPSATSAPSLESDKGTVEGSLTGTTSTTSTPSDVLSAATAARDAPPSDVERSSAATTNNAPPSHQVPLSDNAASQDAADNVYLSSHGSLSDAVFAVPPHPSTYKIPSEKAAAARARHARRRNRAARDSVASSEGSASRAAASASAAADGKPGVATVSRSLYAPLRLPSALNARLSPVPRRMMFQPGKITGGITSSITGRITCTDLAQKSPVSVAAETAAGESGESESESDECDVRLLPGSPGPSSTAQPAQSPQSLMRMSARDHWLLKLPPRVWQGLAQYVDDATMTQLSTVHRLFAHIRAERAVRARKRVARLMEIEEGSAFVASQSKRLALSRCHWSGWSGSHSHVYPKACLSCFRIRENTCFPRVLEMNADDVSAGMPAGMEQVYKGLVAQLAKSMKRSSQSSRQLGRPLFVPYIPVPSGPGVTGPVASPAMMSTTGDSYAKVGKTEGKLRRDFRLKDVHHCCLDCAVIRHLLQPGERVVALDGTWRWVCRCRQVHFGDGRACDECHDAF